jgi:hypothetical protein
MQKDLHWLNKLNSLKSGACRKRARGDDAFKGMGLIPHRHLNEILLNSYRRKDGQFRSGGLLVGDRPFSLEMTARRRLSFTAYNRAVFMGK